MEFYNIYLIIMIYFVTCIMNTALRSTVKDLIKPNPQLENTIQRTGKKIYLIYLIGIIIIITGGGVLVSCIPKIIYNTNALPSDDRAVGIIYKFLIIIYIFLNYCFQRNVWRKTIKKDGIYSKIVNIFRVCIYIYSLFIFCLIFIDFPQNMSEILTGAIFCFFHVLKVIILYYEIKEKS